MTEIGICSVDGCGRPCRSPRMDICNTHYFRIYRTGSVGSAPVAVKNPGATCAIDDCDEPATGRGWCNRHYTRWLRHRDPLIVNAPRLRTGAEHHMWVGDDASYSDVHQRLRRSFGRAPEHACANGCGSRAFQWSYDHADPNGKTSSQGPYSTDLTHYRPLCVPCHKRFDLSRKR